MAKTEGNRSGKRKNSRHPTNKEKPWEPDARDLGIYHQHCMGIPQRKIAEEWGISQPRVSVLVQKINEWMVPQFLAKIKNMKVDHSNRLQHIFEEALHAWNRSKEDAVIEEQSFEGQLPQEVEAPGTGKTIAKSKAVDAKRIRKGQSGGSQYLSEARAALAEIRKIWGADAPIDDTGAGDERVAGKSREDGINAIMQRLQKVTVELVGEK